MLKVVQSESCRVFHVSSFSQKNNFWDNDQFHIAQYIKKQNLEYGKPSKDLWSTSEFSRSYSGVRLSEGSWGYFFPKMKRQFSYSHGKRYGNSGSFVTNRNIWNFMNYYYKLDGATLTQPKKQRFYYCYWGGPVGLCMPLELSSTSEWLSHKIRVNLWCSRLQSKATRSSLSI